MLCGMSSRLTQVTVAPFGTVSGVGANLKLSTWISVASAAATRITAPANATPPASRSVARSIPRRAIAPGENSFRMAIPSDERRVDDGERCVRRHEADLRDTHVHGQ